MWFWILKRVGREKTARLMRNILENFKKIKKPTNLDLESRGAIALCVDKNTLLHTFIFDHGSFV